MKKEVAMKTMTMLTGKGMSVVVVLVMAAVLFSGLPAALGAVVFSESFDGMVGTALMTGGQFVTSPNGQAWRATEGGDFRAFQGFVINLDQAGISRLPQGTIELWLQRGEEDRYEVPLAFVGENYQLLCYFQIDWEGSMPDKRGKTFPTIRAVTKGDYPLWYLEFKYPKEKGLGPNHDGEGRTTVISFGRDISRGEWCHLAFTWGKSPGIYVNGQRLKAKASPNFSMERLINDAYYLVIGSTPRDMGADGPKGGDSLLTSAIDAFRIHDTVVVDSSPVFAGDERPAITSLSHDAVRVAGFSGKLVAGDKLTVEMEGTFGGVATFDVARLADENGSIVLDWRGWGVYLDEDKVFFEDDEVDLEDVEEYRVYVSKEPFTEVTLETEPLETLEVREQSYVIEDLEYDVPYYVGVVAVMDDDTIKPVIMPKVGIPMAEDVEVQAGIYSGLFVPGYGDRYPEAVVIGHLARGEQTVALRAEDELEIDPSLNVDVAVSAAELKADEKSTSKVTVTVTDANGDAVSGHEVRFVLATTSQYTGVVGGGKFLDEVGGTLEREFRGETDLFGQVTATYTAGFAAKTAIIVARDMVSNDTGAGYIKTYIQATAELELEAVQEVAGKALGYAITVTSSDEWLTADGKSTARITALVTKDGQPVEGHKVNFSVTAGTGSIKTVNGTTDRDGKARAVYTAGKKIGIVLITAVDTTVGISGSVQIELRSDAPAKINIKITPEKVPADGYSPADLLVLVTDINDNPNEGVEVEYRIIAGSGRLRDIDKLTDKNGESEATYVAGRIPGKVTIEVTVRSTVPTEEELKKARDLAIEVPYYDFF